MKVELVYERVGGAAPGVNRFVCPELEADSLGGSVSGRIWFRDPLGTNAAGLRVTVEELSAEHLAALKHPEGFHAPESVPAETTPHGDAAPPPPGEGVVAGGEEAPPPEVTAPSAEDTAPPAPEGTTPS